MDEQITPLEFLEAVYTNEDLELPVRLRAATAAAQYVHPKLEARANFNFDETNLKRRLERAHRLKAELDEARAKGPQAVREQVESLRLIEGTIEKGETIADLPLAGQL